MAAAHAELALVGGILSHAGQGPVEALRGPRGLQQPKSLPGMSTLRDGRRKVSGGTRLGMDERKTRMMRK